MEIKMDQAFKGKRILFLDSSENLYHQGLVKSMTALGAELTERNYRHFMNQSFYGKFTRFYLKKKNVNIQKFVNSINGEFDIVFVMSPEVAPQELFIKLKAKYVNTIFIYYTWNSNKICDFSKHYKLFDRQITFDPQDAKEFGMEYYPLFYLDDFERIGINATIDKEYQIASIGSGFSNERRQFFNILLSLVQKEKIPYYFYLYIASLGKYIKYKYFIRNNPCSILGRKWVNKEKLLEIYSKSISFIDFKKKQQTGYNMRVFETLASGLLLITTDTSLKYAPFYDPARILIIEENLQNLNLEIVRRYKPSFPTEFEKYRVDNWLKHVLLNY